MTSFIDRLAAAVRRKKSPLVVGLDPRYDQLPRPLKAPADRAGLTARATAYRDFCRGVIDVVAPLVPAVKPQAAFFEQLGPAGMQALREVIDHARQQQLLVIIDAKRSDIGSTASAYAEAWLATGTDAPWRADALTVSPYLGQDSLSPFVDAARTYDGGVFVLVKTSNPGGALLQDLQCDGRPVYHHVAQQVQRWAEETLGACGYGAVGAVVGATFPRTLAQLREMMPHCWFLVPGFGAQGGLASDVAGAFAADGLGAVVNSSRSIIFAHSRPPYTDRFTSSRWQDAIAAATTDALAELRGQTPAGNL